MRIRMPKAMNNLRRRRRHNCAKLLRKRRPASVIQYLWVLRCLRRHRRSWLPYLLIWRANTKNSPPKNRQLKATLRVLIRLGISQESRRWEEVKTVRFKSSKRLLKAYRLRRRESCWRLRNPSPLHRPTLDPSHGSPRSCLEFTLLRLRLSSAACSRDLCCRLQSWAGRTLSASLACSDSSTGSGRGSKTSTTASRIHPNSEMW